MLQPQSAEATVVAFRPDTLRRRPDRAEGDARGIVLLFTGVRYERMQDQTEGCPDLESYDPVDDSACS